jgi:hypothetical protein
MGGGGVKAWDALTSDDPWRERADKICLHRGNEYLNVEGARPDRLLRRIVISNQALSELRELQSSVPTRYQLGYGTVLSDKSDFIHLLRRQVRLVEAGKPTEHVDDSLSATFHSYGEDAQSIGLSVCGQGTGEQ